MRKIKDAVRHLTAAVNLPPQLSPGTPLVEMIGRNTLILTHHKGLTEYTAQKICAKSSEGLLTVTGNGLTLTQMNAERLTVSGKIDGVIYTEGKQ